MKKILSQRVADRVARDLFEAISADAEVVTPSFDFADLVGKVAAREMGKKKISNRVREYLTRKFEEGKQGFLEDLFLYSRFPHSRSELTLKL